MNSTTTYLEAETIAHPHDIGFVEDQLKAFPNGLHNDVLAQYQVDLAKHGRQVANLGLLKTTDQLKDCAKHEDDHTLKSRAAVKAARCESLFHAKGFQALCDFVENEGITLPTVPASTLRLDHQNPVEAGIVTRLINVKWWTRQLRKQQDRRQEQLAIQLGIVGFGKQAYCSDASLMQVLSRRSLNREHMESLDAVNQDTGEVLPMTQIINAGVANPENLRHETMQKIADAEIFYQERGYVSLFLTLTLPSKYHRMKKVGGYMRVNSDGKQQRLGTRVIPNPNYQSTIQWESGRGKQLTYQPRTNNPRLAQERLRLNWSRARAALNDAQIAYEWLRATEPHHDGCPHWHMVAFVKADDVKRFTQIIWRYWLKEDQNEWGARKNRVEIVRIKQKKGGAASYVAKYIAKNIDGFKVGEDFESGLTGEDSVLRVQAWRSTWGIRGFQFSQGLGSIGVWRELRRIAQDKLNGLSGTIKQAYLAADDSHYYGFLKLQYQLQQQGEALKPLKQIKPIPNSYGELLTITIGIQHADQANEGEVTTQIITRPYHWELVKRQQPTTFSPASAPSSQSSQNIHSSQHSSQSAQSPHVFQPSQSFQNTHPVPSSQPTAHEAVTLILSRSMPLLGILENNCRSASWVDAETEGQAFQSHTLRRLWHDNHYHPELKARPKEQYLTFNDFHQAMLQPRHNGLGIDDAMRIRLLALRDAGFFKAKTGDVL